MIEIKEVSTVDEKVVNSSQDVKRLLCEQLALLAEKSKGIQNIATIKDITSSMIAISEVLLKDKSSIKYY